MYLNHTYSNVFQSVLKHSLKYQINTCYRGRNYMPRINMIVEQWQQNRNKSHTLTA